MDSYPSAPKHLRKILGDFLYKSAGKAFYAIPPEIMIQVKEAISEIKQLNKSGEINPAVFKESPEDRLSQEEYLPKGSPAVLGLDKTAQKVEKHFKEAGYETDFNRYKTGTWYFTAKRGRETISGRIADHPEGMAREYPLGWIPGHDIEIDINRRLRNGRLEFENLDQVFSVIDELTADD